MTQRTLAQLLVTMVALVPAAAPAEETDLGRVLDKGAVRLTKADLDALIPGTTTKFTQWTTGSRAHANVDYSWENPPGGASFRAFARWPRMSGNGTGTWSIADNGRYCWDIMMDREWKACRFIFKIGDGYYMSPSATDRAAKATSVKFDK
jgi:hypothetical protein